MKAPSPPAAPDPFETAAAQQVANVEVAIANSFLQNADEDRPDGSVRFVFTGEQLATYTYDGDGNVTGTRNVPKFKKVVTLSAEGQTNFTQQQQLAIQFNTVALTQAMQMQSNLQTPLSLAGLTPRPAAPVAATLDQATPTAGPLVETIGATDLTAHIAAVRDAISDRLEWQIGVDRNARLVNLSHQGIFVGSTAHEREMLVFDRKVNDSRIQAFLAAQQEQNRIIQLEAVKGEFANSAQKLKLDMGVLIIDVRNRVRLQQFQVLLEVGNYINTLRQQELQEAITIRAQTVNEVSSLMHGGQISIPQFQAFRPGQINDTPVGDYVYRTAAIEQQQYQTKVQSQQAMFGGIMGLAGSVISLSDRRLKTDIEHVADDARGFGWYLWRYLWDRPGVRRFGVMAQEVRAVVPWAVADIGGVLAVDYEALR